MVVQEFRAAIEERGVVFVALDDELFPAAQAIAAVAKIGNDSANQKIGAAAGGVKNPGEHGGGGRLAVGARDDDRGVPGNEKFLEQLRHRAVGDFFVENEFDFGISARDHVADDGEIRRGLQILFAVAFVPANAERIEKRRRGRIDVDV